MWQSEARERDGRRRRGKPRVWRVRHWAVAILRAHAATGRIIRARRRGRGRIIRWAANAIRIRNAILTTDADAVADAAIRDGRDGRGVLPRRDGRARPRAVIHSLHSKNK